EIPDWPSQAALEYIENGDAVLSISSRNPDLLSDIDPERIALSQKADLKKWEKASSLVMQNAVNWSVVASPTIEWACKVFPEASGKEAVQKLWEAIFQVCRIDQPDPIDAWRKHIENLKKRSDYL